MESFQASLLAGVDKWVIVKLVWISQLWRKTMVYLLQPRSQVVGGTVKSMYPFRIVRFVERSKRVFHEFPASDMQG
jgi:hypothetical protein